MLEGGYAVCACSVSNFGAPCCSSRHHANSKRAGKTTLFPVFENDAKLLTIGAASRISRIAGIDAPAADYFHR